MERYEVVDARYAGGFRIWFRFGDGSAGQVDFARRLTGPVFLPLRDRARFRRFRLEPLWGTIRWPGGADWAPEDLHLLARSSSGEAPPHARARLRRNGTGRGAAITHSGPRDVSVGAMPNISRFYGFVIAMLYRDQVRPHFHARHGGGDARVDIRTGVVRGNLPPPARRMLTEWATAHRAELLDNWDRARRKEPLVRIAPYRRGRVTAP